MLDKRTNQPITSSSTEAIELYNGAVDLILGSESGAEELLDEAMALDKDFAMAAAARYYAARDSGEAEPDIYRETAITASGRISEWEKRHIDVLCGLIDRPADTRNRALKYIEENPADLLVIAQMTGNMIFFDGPKKLVNVLNLFESVEHALADDWAFISRLGFAASEAGQRQRGRALLEKAYEARPQSLYVVHGLAHLMHDEGAAEESARLLRDWLEQYESAASSGQMYGHVQWHLALAEWQTGDREAAMMRYHAHCSPETTTCGPVLTLADCAGLLLRDYLHTGEAKPLQRGVIDHIDKVWGMMGHPFIALHVAGLYASAEDIEGLARCKAALDNLPEGENRDVSRLLLKSITEYVQGNYEAATQTLAELPPEARIGIGGSNVERILVELIEQSCKKLH